MTKSTTPFSKSILSIVILIITFSIIGVGSLYAQAQTIGSFPSINGGFENQSTLTIRAAIATGTTYTDYSLQNAASDGSIITTGCRTGSKCFKFTPNAITDYFMTPTADASAIASATSYTVQFYFKSQNTASGTATVSISPNGTVNFGTGVATSTFNNTAWTKKTVTVTSGTSAASPRYGTVKFVKAGNTKWVAFDDLVLYAGAVDVTAPTAASGAAATFTSSTAANITWTGVANAGDGGGYVIVRSTAATAITMNANGIYGVGNTSATGSGIVVGIVAGVTGTNTFSDATLTAGTRYYYSIFAVDKAFNYAAAATCNLVPPTVTTQATSSIATTTATANGTITAIGSGVITSGICWNTSTAPTTANSKTTNGPTTAIAYTGSITGLTANTLYYVRAYATGAGTIYGNEVTFTSLPNAPTSTAGSSITPSGFTANWTAPTGGVAAYTYTVEVTTTSGNYSSPIASYSSIASGTLSQAVTGLNQGTTYYYHIKAVNASGSGAWSTERTVTTLNPPIVTTQAVSSIATTTATGNGTITSVGSGVTTSGICWKTTTGPTIANSKTTNGPTTAIAYTGSITGLTANTIYYVRPYGTGPDGTSYGSEVTFITLPNAPTSTAGTSITSSSFNANWTAPAGGVQTYTYTLEVSTTSGNYTSPIATFTSIASGTLSQAVTGLNPGTSYYYHIKAVNATGSSAWCTTERTVTTLSAPVETTQAVTSIATTTATGNATITLLGSGVTTSGLCWNTSTAPTTGNSKTTNGPTTAIAYTGSLTGLTANTLYYVRAYGTGPGGTSYGNEVTFITLPNAPTSAAGTSITSSSFNANWTAPAGGVQTYTYTVEVTTTSGNYTSPIASFTSIASGTLSQAVTGLSPITNYYYHIKAVNATGSGAWSTEKTVTTLSSPVETTQAVSSIATTTATGNATITAVGSGVTTSGICWKTSTGPTTADSKTTNGPTTAIAYTGSITSLTANTIYYVKAYATGPGGTSYGSEVNFTTLPNAPTVGTGNNITATGFRANWTSPSGGAASYTYTIEVSTNSSDFTSPAATQSGIASGTLLYSFTGLSSATTYYYRVKAVNTTGSGAWSAVSSGVTTNCATPTTYITSGTTAICSGDYTDITLSGSQSGVTYQLYKGASTVGGTTAGSGSALTWSVSTAGTYTVQVVATGGYCSATMTGNAIVTINPIPTITTVATPTVCSGTEFSFTPVNGADGTIPSGTTYSWSEPLVTGEITGGTTGTDASSITGTLINSTGLDQTATYTVTPLSGSCIGSDFIVSTTISPIPTLTVADGNTCPGGTVTFNAISDVAGSTFKWYQTAVSATVLGSSNIFLTPALTDSISYFVEATANGCSTERTQVLASLSEINTTWTGAYDDNWNNAENWSDGVPCTISTITIPNVCTPGVLYPVLTGPVECKNIVFEPGAAVLGLQNLTYEKAFIKTQLQRDKWYTLTVPLKEMYSGDYYFTGAPEAYMRLFDTPSPDAIGPNTTYTGTFTRSFASLQVPLTQGEGFCFKISQKTWNYPSGFSNVATDKTTTFPQLKPDSSLVTSYVPYSAFNGMPYTFDTKTVSKNASLAYRFAAENASNQLADVSFTLKPGINLIGNPLMTHLDFNLLYTHNSAVIENKVKFWNGSTFTTYMSDSELTDAITSSDNTSNIIPPMQAFFVVSPLGGTLTFDLDYDFVADNSMNLRGASVKPNVLFIESNNGVFKSSTAIAKRDQAKNGFDNNDAFKLFSQYQHVPEVYTLSEDMALDINQFNEYPYTVPLCIKTDSGTVAFNFSGVESFGDNVTVELINAKTGEVQDLKADNNYSYKVNAGKDEGVLFLSFRNATIATDNKMIGINHDIQIFSNEDHIIKVISTPNDPIREVLVFDTAGRKIQHCCVSKTSTIDVPVFVKNEVYMVQVFTQNNTRIAKVLVK